MARDDIVFDAGRYHGGSSIGFDRAEGFFIAGGNVNFPRVDNNRSYVDMLFIVGGVVSSGSGPVGIQRSLVLRDNSLYPTLLFVYDPKYAEISKLFLREKIASSTILQDVGFKPL